MELISMQKRKNNVERKQCSSKNSQHPCQLKNLVEVLLADISLNTNVFRKKILRTTRQRKILRTCLKSQSSALLEKTFSDFCGLP
jgi:hypothetical protein